MSDDEGDDFIHLSCPLPENEFLKFMEVFQAHMAKVFAVPEHLLRRPRHDFVELVCLAVMRAKSGKKTLLLVPNGLMQKKATDFINKKFGFWPIFLEVRTYTYDEVVGGKKFLSHDLVIFDDVDPQ